MRLFDLLVLWLRRVVSRPESAKPALRGWARDWSRYARLNLDALEARLAPGSLLGLTMPLDELGVSADDAPLPPAPAPAVSGLAATTTTSIPTTQGAALVEPGEPIALRTVTVAPASNPAQAEQADLAFLVGLLGATAGQGMTEGRSITSAASLGGTVLTSGGSTNDAPRTGESGLGSGGVAGGQTGPTVSSEGVAFLGVRNNAGEIRMATNDTTPTLVGTGTPGAGIRVTLDGGATALATVAANGRWEATVASPLNDGEYNGRIDELGSGGAIASSAKARFTVDTAAPTVTLAVENDHVIGDPTFHVSFADGASKRASEFRVVFDIDLTRDGDYDDANESAAAETTAVAGQDVPYLWSGFMPGTFNVQARVIDEAGNVGTSNALETYKAIGTPDPTGSASPGEGAPPTAGMGPGTVAPGTEETQPGEPPAGDPPAGGGGGTSGLVISETEPNNTTGNANTITLNPGDPTTINGNISTGTDADFFTFTLGARTGVFFDIDSRETGLSTTLNSRLTVLNAAGTQVTNGQNDNGYDFDTGMPAPAGFPSATTADSALYLDFTPGTYFVRVDSVGGTTGAYALNIRSDTNYSTTVPSFSSLPGATGTVYLDFNGHASTTDQWVTSGGAPGGYNALAFDFNGNAAEWSPGEREFIRNVWRVVSEDYSPFNVNVTTVLPSQLTTQVAHVVVTNSPNTIVGAAGAAGIAWLGSFNNSDPLDNVSWVFAPSYGPIDSFFGGNGGSGAIMAVAHEFAEVASHESGHQFSLGHYGAANPDAIMRGDVNTGLRRRVWNTGTLVSAGTGFQDDMAVISNATNAVGYRTDDHLGSVATTSNLAAITSTVYGGSGVISQIATDRDWLRFTGPATAGTVTINVTVDDYLNDLRPSVFLRDAAGNVIASGVASATGTPNWDVTLTANLSGLIYYVDVGSAGGAGEAGQYSVLVTLPAEPPPPPGGGGGGGGGPQTFNGDIFEDNDTSAEASARGTLTATQTFNLLTVNVKDGLPDYDWFRWTAGASGTMTVTTTVTAGGNIEVTLWRLDGNTLVQLAADARPYVSVRTVTAAVTAGQTYLVQVKGRNPSPGVMEQASYNMTAVIA